MGQVTVIGAGIAGLTAAYRLQQSGHRVTVLEASGHAGGVIRSERVEGYLLEHGPNSVQAKSGAIDALVQELHLGAEQCEADDAAKRRYVVRRGKPIAVPDSPPAFLTSRLFSLGAKLRLVREPFIDPAPAGAEESVAQFVRRRLGNEFLDYAINPFVAGVYAGDPERLAVRHAFPKLHALEQQYGSLIRGQIKKKKEGTLSGGASPAQRMFSFREGMEALPRKMAEALGDHLHVATPVHAVRPVDGGWEVLATHDGRHETFASDAVVLAVPLHRLNTLHLETRVYLDTLLDVYYPPVTVIYLGYRRDQVAHPLDGFGILVPEVEKQLCILGTLFSSTLFPDRAPDGHVLLTTFVGGARHPELTRTPDQVVIDQTMRDLSTLLGIKGAPPFSHLVRWQHAIPQYNRGYGRVKETIDELERRHPGLFLAGSFRQGIAVSDSLDSGIHAAEAVAAYL